MSAFVLNCLLWVFLSLVRNLLPGTLLVTPLGSFTPLVENGCRYGLGRRGSIVSLHCPHLLRTIAYSTSHRYRIVPQTFYQSNYWCRTMRHYRPDLLKGLTVLGIFFAVIISTELLLPYPIAHTRYTSADIRKIIQNPIPFEGHEISSAAAISTVISNESFSVAEVAEGIILIFPSSVGSPGEGDSVLFRGTSWIHSNNSVLVHEFYTLDSDSSKIRSIPGILLFLVMFFTVFTIDFNRLAFVTRRHRNA